jgi:hypothetical protein
LPEIKLAKLPDRTPVKITITVSSELSRALISYAERYANAYNQVEPVAELVPFMLQAFLESDREFAKALKSRTRDIDSSSSEKLLRREVIPTASGTAKDS